MVFLGVPNNVNRPISCDVITSVFFCSGQYQLHGGLVVVLATYFTVFKLKRLSQMQTLH